jgi:hypothetical protein
MRKDMAKPVLTIFPTRTPLGQELAKEVQQMAEAELGFDTYLLENATPGIFYLACIESDAVVLDATIEPDPANHNYSFASTFNLDRLLVVARSYVPLNFGGIRQGGAAKYSDPAGPQGRKTNHEIIEWLRPELREFSRHPRGFLNRIIPRPIRFFADQFSSISRKKSDREAKGRAFVSYRSRYHSSVVSLAHQSRHPQAEGNDETFLFFFAPGELVYEDELMTPLRRWQILSMIQDQLIAAKEVWIYKTENYLDSWWTIGEVLSTLEFTPSDDLKGKLRIYDPDSSRVHTFAESWLPNLTEAHKKRMARYQANSHPDMIAPESRGRSEQVPDIPAIRKLFLADDPVFSSTFWEYYLVPCNARDLSKSGSPEKIGLTEFGHRLRHVDIESFLKLSNESDLISSPGQLDQVVEGVEVLSCKTCRQRIRVSKEKPRYLWAPQPDAALRGGAWGKLVELPVYRAKCGG